MPKIRFKIAVMTGSFVNYAEIDGYRLDMGIKGCPLGRGRTIKEAVDDLIYRVKVESNIDLIQDGELIIRD